MPESTHHQGVTLFKTRPVAYKLGLVFLVSSFFIFIVGFSTPYWISYRSYDVKDFDDFEEFQNKLHTKGDDHHGGLWYDPCPTYAFDCNTGILVAQIVFSFHFAGYVISLTVAAFENNRKVNLLSYHSRKLEICIFVTGILGTAGMAVYVIWYFVMGFFYLAFRWSLAVTSLSLTGIYITFFLIIFGNRKPIFASQGTVLVPHQQGNVIYYNAGNPNSAAMVTNYQPPHSGNEPNQPQNQPLLPQQSYLYPPVPHQHGASPAYALPPSYFSPTQQPQFALATAPPAVETL